MKLAHPPLQDSFHRSDVTTKFERQGMIHIEHREILVAEDFEQVFDEPASTHEKKETQGPAEKKEKS